MQADEPEVPGNPAVPVVKRSEEFWIEGPGTAVFKVENTLYRLSKVSLMDQSVAFFNMFSLPESESPEGTSADYPIVLQGINAKEWEDMLVSCVVIRWSPKPRPPEYWINILKLASLYQIPHMVIKASYKLPAYNDEVLPPAKRLFLARAYNVPDLVDTGFKSLCHINQPLSLMTNDDIESIGFRAMVILAQTKEKIELLRKKVAITPPDYGNAGHVTECKARQDCWRAWKSAWWDLFGRSINQPSLQAPWIAELWSYEVTLHMKKAVGMHPGCLTKMLELTKKDQSSAKQIHEAIELGITRVKEGIVAM
ncbi:hypothetical protein HGRIS_012335 [Hohenbuehelia grisea]|uniref:BTB domain-containing protein n=1 Tax=Hohenbuehelia grisea TaxID=104357 RepID=A0ABR3IS13_9AGAR